MTLIKTSLWTATSTIVKILAGFVINKVIAVYVGPSGLAVVGQLQNFIAMSTTLSNGAIAQGVVKYTAEYKSIREKQKIFSSSLIISLASSFFVSFVLISLSQYWSELILKNIKYDSVFIVFGVTVLLFSLNTILMSILNGQKEIKKYVIVNMASSLVALLLTSFLIIQWGLIGALYALVINQSIIFFVTLAFVIKSKWFKLKYFTHGVDKDSFFKLSKFALMAVTTVLTVPVSHLIVRNYMGENLGWDEAGYWQGIWYISGIYLMIITTSLNVYYLPRLSEIKDKSELKQEVLAGYKLIMPIAILLALSIYLLKEYVILVAFSESFMPMVDLFLWQLVGDVIKIASWLLGYITLAKAMTKTYISLEIFGSLSFIGLSIYFIDLYGLIGVTYAFSLNYAIYMFIMFFIFKRYVNENTVT
jgi:polysaccharide transporter, PST family